MPWVYIRQHGYSAGPDGCSEGSGGGRTTCSCIARKVVVARMAVCGERARVAHVQTVYHLSVLVTIIDSRCRCCESLLLSRVVVVVSHRHGRKSPSWSRRVRRAACILKQRVRRAACILMYEGAASATFAVHPVVWGSSECSLWHAS